MPAFQLPNTQALHSKTFKSAHSLLARRDVALPNVHRWIAQNSPDHPLFVYHDDATDSLQTIAWRDFEKGVNRAAHYLTGFRDKWLADKQVVGILASSGMQT